ncbi:hypothetical protein C8R47DRAFT_1206633 [Mycena vitilis]|nr:hypothetical protein C8R47DRAFT_1206633 [Mycena vitilis]
MHTLIVLLVAHLWHAFVLFRVPFPNFLPSYPFAIHIVVSRRQLSYPTPEFIQKLLAGLDVCAATIRAGRVVNGSTVVFKSMPLALSPPTLPPELLSAVFRIVLGDYWLGTRRDSFFDELFDLSSVCRYWRQTAISTPALWADVALTSKSNPKFISHLLAMSGAMPLQLNLTLGLRPKWSHAAVLSATLPDINRAQTLSISCATSTSGNEVATFLRDIPLPIVRNLRIRIHARHTLRIGGHMQNGLTRLHVLHLCRIGLPWSVFGTFRFIRVIVLCDLDEGSAPELLHWVALSQSALLIERMCLHNIGCTKIPAAAPALHFDRVVEMDLLFGSSDQSLSHLLSLFRTPVLDTLTVSAQSIAPIQSLVLHDKLSKVETLALHIADPDLSATRVFFRAMHQLQQLDALHSDAAILSSLTSVTGNAPVACPSLSRLFVTSANPVEVANFLRARRSRSSMIRQVTFRNGLPMGSYYDSEIMWMRSVVSVVEGFRRCDPAWMRFGSDHI